MSKPFISLAALFISFFCNGQSMVQLAPPLLKYQSVFFKTSLTVELKFAQQGTQIHYSLNNQQATGQDKIYKKPIQVKKSFTTIKAIATGIGFLPSESVSATFIKDGLKIKSVQQTPANEKYKGNGIRTLIDNEGGLTGLNSKTWLGYQLDSVEIIVELEKKQKLSSVMIHCLQDHGSWIFLPEQVRVYYLDESSGSFELMAQQFTHAEEMVNGAICQPQVLVASKKIIAGKLKIILNGISALPGWHPGKGRPGWLFIDELKVY